MASKSFGGTVKLTGESEYQKALRGITDNLKVLNSEMKVVTSQYDKNDGSAEIDPHALRRQGRERQFPYRIYRQSDPDEVRSPSGDSDPAAAQTG